MKDIKMRQSANFKVDDSGKGFRLSNYFISAAHDENICMPHICIYLSLFYVWSINNFENPIQITRYQIMTLSKISGIATFHRCIKDLDNGGYIKYELSFHPAKGSTVYMLK